MITILGAGGAIGNELVKLLAAKNQPFRLVGRNPKATPGATETLAADLTDRDQTDSSRRGLERRAPARGSQIRSQGLAGHVAADHEQYHRSLQTRRRQADLL